MLTPAQLAERSKGVGASEVAAILGVDPYRTAYDVWASKTGKVDAFTSSDAADIGNEIEGCIFRLAEPRLNCKIVRPTSTFVRGFLRANVDGMIDRAMKGAEIVEAKSTGMVDGWGEPGTDQVPDRVLVQVQAQMLASESGVAHVARLLARFGFAFDLFRVQRSDRFAGIITEAVDSFWQCVQRDTPPVDSVGSLEVLAAIVRTPGKTISVPDSLLDDYRTAKALLKTVTEEADAAKARLLTAMGDAEIATANTGTATNRLVQTNRLDVAALKAAMPKVTEQFTVPSSYRRLDVRAAKKGVTT